MPRLNLQLSINKPCNEKWESMVPGSKSRFCNNCSKQVVDFSQLSNTEIIELIELSQGTLCGRLKSDQLNRTLPYVQQTNAPALLYPVMTGLVFFSISGTALANFSKICYPDQPVISYAPFYLKTLNEASVHKSANDTVVRYIKGQIIDSTTREAIAGAVIMLKNNRTGTVADNNGCFQLKISDQFIEKPIEVVISSLGYTSTFITIYENDEGPKQYTFTPLDRYILGITQIAYVKKKKWWQVWKK